MGSSHGKTLKPQQNGDFRQVLTYFSCTLDKLWVIKHGEFGTEWWYNFTKVIIFASFQTKKSMKTALEVREIAESRPRTEEIDYIRRIPERIEDRARSGYTTLYATSLNGWRSDKTDPVTLAKREIAEDLIEKGYWLESGSSYITIHWDEKPEVSAWSSIWRMIIGLVYARG